MVKRITFLNSSLMGLSKCMAKVVIDNISESVKNQGYDVTIQEYDLNVMMKQQMLTTVTFATFYDDIDEYLDILKSSDIIVCATSLINYHASPSLIAFFNKIILSGVTFCYRNNLPVPLIDDFKQKKVYIVATAGTPHKLMPKGPDVAFDNIKGLFEYVGFSDIKLMYIPGTDADDNYKKGHHYLCSKYAETLKDI